MTGSHKTHEAVHWIYNGREENLLMGATYVLYTGIKHVQSKADVMSRSFMEKEPQRENLLEAEDSVEERDSLKKIDLIPYGNV